MKTFFAIVAFALAYTPCSGSSYNKLETEIQEIMRMYHAVGLSTTVVKSNKIIYTRSFGYNPDYNDTTIRKPIPDDGVYVIASISKSFIATAIMQLVEKRKVYLDADVNNYLEFKVRNPNFPYVPITVRMLLNHRSTINDKHYGWTLNQINPQKGIKWRECYDAFRPGTRFSYCNLNYSLLGSIIENVTGEKFFDYIDEHIVNPLGLNASYNITKIDSNKLVRAYIYDKKLKRFKKDPSIYNYKYYEDKLTQYELGLSTACFSPSGGMKISVGDLAKWMMMHMNEGKYNGKRIIKKSSEREMWKGQGEDAPNDSFFSEYGLSFSHWNKIIEGESLIGITGSAHGVQSIMFFNPRKKYGFVVICNGSTTGLKLNNSVVKILYKHLINC